MTNRSVAAWAVAVLLTTSLPPKPAKALEVEKALALIEANERRYQAEQWTIEFRQGKLIDIDDMKTITFGPVVHKGRVILDPVSGRYRSDLESVMRWVNGAADHIAQRQSWSYNGRELRDVAFVKPGKKLPSNPPKLDEDQGHGRIFREGDQKSEFPAFQVPTGIGEMPPNFRGGKLSAMIREGLKLGPKRPVAVVEAEGVWKVTTPEPDGDSTILIDYDPGKGVVLQAVWKNGNPERAWSRYVVELQKVGNDYWVPKTIHVVNLIDKLVDRFVYSDVRINEKLDGTAFTLEFPPRVKVIDYVRKASYVVGAGTADDRESIRRFITQHNLAPETGSPPVWASWTWQRTNLLILSAAVLVVVGLFFFRRPRATGIVALLALGLSAGDAGAGESVGRPECDKGGNWVFRTATGETISTRQCGFMVTVFALEYFGVEYDSVQTSKSLPPNEDGVRLSDVRDVLRGHGLDVEARQGVRVKNLDAFVGPGVLAILPLRMTETNSSHYLVVARPKEGRDAVVLDVPMTSKPLAKSLTDEMLAPTQGLVLFVKRSERPRVPKELVRAEPARIDLGTIVMGTNEASTPLKKSFRIKNHGTSPVMVCRVVKSCGCLDMNYEGGLLAPGESREVSFMVLPASMGGTGQQSKVIAFRFSDATELAVPVTATTIDKAEAQKIVVAPASLQIDLSDAKAGVRLEETVRVTHGPGRGRVRAVAKAPWLAVEAIPVNDTETNLRLSVTPDVALLGGLSESKSAVGTVAVAIEADAPPVEVAVRLYVKDFADVRPQLVHASRGGPEPALVTVRPLAHLTKKLVVARVWSDAEDLTLEQQDESDGSVSVRVKTGSRPGARPAWDST